MTIGLLSIFPPYSEALLSGSSADKESTYNTGDPGSIPGSGRSPGEETGYPLQYIGLEISWTV